MSVSRTIDSMPQLCIPNGSPTIARPVARATMSRITGVARMLVHPVSHKHSVSITITNHGERAGGFGPTIRDFKMLSDSDGYFVYNPRKELRVNSRELVLHNLLVVRIRQDPALAVVFALYQLRSTPLQQYLCSVLHLHLVYNEMHTSSRPKWAESSSSGRFLSSSTMRRPQTMTTHCSRR